MTASRLGLKMFEDYLKVVEVLIDVSASYLPSIQSFAKVSQAVALENIETDIFSSRFLSSNAISFL